MANEVRSLAGRCGDEAERIHRLVENSVRRVAQGESLVAQTHTALDTMRGELLIVVTPNRPGAVTAAP